MTDLHAHTGIDYKDPYARLAAGVILNAVRDASTRWYWKDAVRWLATPSADLNFWCTLANIDMNLLVEFTRSRWAHRLQDLAA